MSHPPLPSLSSIPPAPSSCSLPKLPPPAALGFPSRRTSPSAFWSTVIDSSPETDTSRLAPAASSTASPPVPSSASPTVVNPNVPSNIPDAHVQLLLQSPAGQPPRQSRCPTLPSPSSSSTTPDDSLGTTCPPVIRQISHALQTKGQSSQRSQSKGAQRDESINDREVQADESRKRPRSFPQSLSPMVRYRKKSRPCPAPSSNQALSPSWHSRNSLSHNQPVQQAEAGVQEAEVGARSTASREAGAHDDSKPFSCPKCLARFDREGHLKVHIQAVHNKARPFPCPGCDAAFGHSSSMLRHMRTFKHFPRGDTSGGSRVTQRDGSSHATKHAPWQQTRLVRMRPSERSYYATTNAHHEGSRAVSFSHGDFERAGAVVQHRSGSFQEGQVYVGEGAWTSAVNSASTSSTFQGHRSWQHEGQYHSVGSYEQYHRENGHDVALIGSHRTQQLQTRHPGTYQGHPSIPSYHSK